MDLDSTSPRIRRHSSDASLTVVSANLNSRLFLERVVQGTAPPRGRPLLPSPSLRAAIQQGSRWDLSIGKVRTDCCHSSGRALSPELETCHLPSSCGSGCALGNSMQSAPVRLAISPTLLPLSWCRPQRGLPSWSCWLKPTVSSCAELSPFCLYYLALCLYCP